MLNSSRGGSVIVSSVLLIAVGISAAAILWSAFSMPSMPQSNVAQILEDIKIVKVTPNGDGTFDVYVLNKGSTLAIVDSLYVESINGSYSRVYEIDPTYLDPGNVKVISIDNLDLSKPAVLKAITVQGAQSSVLVMEPQEGQMDELNSNISAKSELVLPYRLYYHNGSYSDLNDDALENIDLRSITIPTNLTLYFPDSDIPLPNFIENELINLIYVGNHFQIPNSIKNRTDIFVSIPYTSQINMPQNGMIQQMVLEINLSMQLPGSSSSVTDNLVEICFYDWQNQRYADQSYGTYHGYYSRMVNLSRGDSFAIIVNDPMPFINENGIYKFAVNISHISGGNGQLIVFVTPVYFNYALPIQIFNSTFIFNLQDFDIEKIESASLTMTYSISYSPVNFDINVDGTKLMSHTYSLNAGTLETTTFNVSKSFMSNLVDNTLKINIFAMVSDVSEFDFNIDEVRLNLRILQ